MPNLVEILKQAVADNVSDVHISVASPVIYRKNGALLSVSEEILKPQDTEEMIFSMLRESQQKTLEELGELDFAYSIAGVARFRVNAFRQRGTYAAAIRVVVSTPPDARDIGLSDEIISLADKRSGLVLVTGPTGSGKSTTLAALIDYINTHKSHNVITVEDPIEYLHKNKKSIISQREIGSDTLSYANALRAALRQDPDVILIGEMRDHETISVALTAAETGHLVFSTVHTVGAAKTIDRVTDIFEPFQQQQIRVQLSTVLRGVISQQLLPKADGTGRVAAFEIMFDTPAISNNIREAKTFQINNAIQTNRAMGMVSMDAYLSELVKKGLVTFETALSYAVDSEQFSRLANNL